MNPEIKAQWVAALRSGEYQQGIGNLEQDGKFCCLGVLCDLAVKAGVAKRVAFHIPDSGNIVAYETNFNDTSQKIPPAGVASWAGLDFKTPVVTRNGNTVQLAFLNDNQTPFATIADLIEEQL